MSGTVALGLSTNIFRRVRDHQLYLPCNGGDYYLKVISLKILKFLWRPSRAYSSLRANGIVILYMEHLLTSHPTDKYKKNLQILL